jgi:hypothetical protein
MVSMGMIPSYPLHCFGVFHERRGEPWEEDLKCIVALVRGTCVGDAAKRRYPTVRVPLSFLSGRRLQVKIVCGNGIRGAMGGVRVGQRSQGSVGQRVRGVLDKESGEC